MRRALATAAVAGVLAFALPASAQLFPARSGESGMLDVPDGETLPRGFALFGGDLRFDKRSGTPGDAGPFPLYAAGGFGYGLETGLTMREGGQPGDPYPQRVLFGAAAKLQLVRSAPRVPAMALDVTVDRLNASAVTSSRLIASTRASGVFRLSAFAGGELGTKSGVIWGAALSTAVRRGADVVVEALGGPRGASYGAAYRWRANPIASFSIGFNYLPDDDGFHVSLGLGVGPRMKQVPAEAAPAIPQVAPEAAPTPQAVAFKDERPRFRMRMHTADPTGAEPRALRHGPWTAVVASAAPAAQAPTAVRSAAPSLDDLADAQLRDQEALAEGRERRVRATADQLDAREKAALEEARRLEQRERELAAREQQLDARDKRIAVRGVPTQQQRDLEALEAQLASQERNLSAQERSYGPAIDAAQGRERDAAGREEAERQEASRLAASAAGVSSRAVQVDLRRQALAARNRQLASLETRLVAKGERIDALERQSRTKNERLDAWQRRLDARGERLDLLERRLAEPRAGTVAPPRPAAGAGVAPKDKAVFVMVVKSPTSIVKERASAPSAAAAGAAIHPGVAVEKAVAAATVVTFASPAAQLSELDRETIDNIARLAAKEQCELLIWARAKDPGLMGEAQRRAAEIRTRVMTSGPLTEKQVVTRITTRPGAQGVDVVVSALRETAKPAPAAAAPAPAAPAAAGPSLEAGEAGKRQIREAVQAAQASIEACVADMMEQRKLARAEGVLKLTVSTAGKVAKVGSEGDLAGTGVAECLTGASGTWLFPHADAEYVVDVPITVIRGGAAR